MNIYMSCVKENNSICQYREDAFMYKGDIYVKCNKHNNAQKCSFCYTCSDFHEKIKEDYDWKDHWC